MTRTLSVAAAVDDFYRAVPRLIIVAGRAVISFALWHGVNRALCEEGGSDDVRELAAGYRGDNALMAVVRLFALLDGHPKMVSFKRLHRHLERDDVIAEIVKRTASPMIWRNEALPAIEAFRRAYEGTFVSDLHNRLIHFRAVGVAHLTIEEIEKRVTYGEIEHLSRSVARMSESLTVFAPDVPPLIWECEIENWSDRARKTWTAALGLAEA